MCQVPAAIPPTAQRPFLSVFTVGAAAPLGELELHAHAHEGSARRVGDPPLHAAHALPVLRGGRHGERTGDHDPDQTSRDQFHGQPLSSDHGSRERRVRIQEPPEDVLGRGQARRIATGVATLAVAAVRRRARLARAPPREREARPRAQRPARVRRHAARGRARLLRPPRREDAVDRPPGGRGRPLRDGTGAQRGDPALARQPALRRLPAAPRAFTTTRASVFPRTGRPSPRSCARRAGAPGPS